MISDEQLQQLLAPSHQQHVGPLIDPDPISRDLAITGQLSPVFEREFDATQGRYLSGLGAAEGRQVMHHEHALERKEHAELFDLEAQDDVLGSGIFDPQRRPATANGNVGVFASHYSLPGYHAREVPFAVNTEITDITSGADVVGIPAGGLNYIEQGGRAQPYGRQPTQYEPYAEINKRPTPTQWDVDSVLNVADGGTTPAEGNRMVPVAQGAQIPTNEEVPSFMRPSHPARQPMWQIDDTPGWPSHRTMAQRPVQHHVGRRMTVTPAEANYGIPTNASMVPAGHRAMQPRRRAPGVQNAANVAPMGAQMAPRQQNPYARTVSAPVSAQMSGLAGFLPAGTGTWLVFLGAGVVGGVALRMLFGKG